MTIRKKRTEIENHRKTLGKQLMCSNDLSLDALKMAEIYIYRDQIEKANHHLKSIDIVSVTPIWIWNDVQIEAHVFTVFLSYFLSRILYHRIVDKGVAISYETALAELEAIQEGINIYNTDTQEIHVQHIVTEMSLTQKEQFKELELKDYLRGKHPGLEYSLG